MTNYYRTYANIDLDAITHNVVAVKNHVTSDVKVMAVIKADGYGHGAIPIGKQLELLNIDYIGVAIYQEGVQLRKAGITRPILVLGNTPKQAFAELFNYELTQTVYSITMANELEAYANSVGKNIKIHVKVDSGMGRIGLRLIHEPLINVIKDYEYINACEHLQIEGLYTHLSKADESDKTYSNEQIEVFQQLVDHLDKLKLRPEIVHASNSAGIIDLKNARFNMVRLGISLYGLYPSEEVDHNVVLKPVLSWVTRIVNLKEVGINERISYGGTFITNRVTRVATLPIGYADGYSRSLSNKGQVVINGQIAPIIGRVCMDQIMVDVTDIENVNENDEVILIGGNNKAKVSVDDIADIMETINYEVVCLISKRVPRVYMKENEVVETIDYFN